MKHTTLTAAAVLTVVLLSAGCSSSSAGQSLSPSSRTSSLSLGVTAEAGSMQPGATSGKGLLATSETPWWQLKSSPEPKPPATSVPVSISGDVLFEPDNATLNPGAASQLNTVFDTLLEPNPGAVVTIVGHINSTGSGSEASGVALSLARAESVKNYLVSRGWPEAAISAVGVGASQPLYPSDSDVHLAANRRCDITVTTRG